MNLIINPGSRVPDRPANLYSVALDTAQHWLTRMQQEFPEVVMLDPPAEDQIDDGRWTFVFRHQVTGVEVELCTHGITEAEADRAGLIFGSPRIYWNGWSSCEPSPADWLPSGGGWGWSYRFTRNADQHGDKT